MIKQNVKNYAFLTAAIALISIATMGVVSAATNLENHDAQNQKSFNKGRGQGEQNRPELTEEQKTEMEAKRAEMEVRREVEQKALESGDYNAWKEAAGDTRIAEQITDDNFAKFVEMHKALQNKDFETAENISEELGLKGGFGMGEGMPSRDGHRGFGPGMKLVDKNGDGVCEFSEQDDSQV